MMAGEIDPDQLIQFACQHVDRAVESTNRANPDREIDSVEDLYELLVDDMDMEIYTIELDLHEFELMQLLNSMMDGLKRMQHADELAFRSNIIAKLVTACPEHLERMEQMREELDDANAPRGFQ